MNNVTTFELHFANKVILKAVYFYWIAENKGLDPTNKRSFSFTFFMTNNWTHTPVLRSGWVPYPQQSIA